MKARLVAFKGRRRDIANNYGIIEVAGENAASLIGRKVTWKSNGGKRITGVIVRTHGKDALLVRFRKGLPGDALGDSLELKKKPKKVKAVKAAKKKEAPAKKKAAKKKAAKKEVKKETKKEKAPSKKTKKPADKKGKKAPGKAGKTKAPTKAKTKKKPSAKSAKGGVAKKK
jgi:ribosomal protein L35AE/L33A